MAPKLAASLALLALARHPAEASRTFTYDALNASRAEPYPTGQSFFYLKGLVAFKKNGMSKTLCGYSKDCSVADNLFDSHWELKYDAVTNALKEIPEQYRTGAIRKANDLGEFILNYQLWKTDPYLQAIALGAPPEVHAWVRPILDKLMGHDAVTWNSERVRTHVKKFLKGKTSFETVTDTYLLCTKLLHKFLLRIEFSDEEANEFVEWQGKLPVFIVLPNQLSKSAGGGKALRAFRDKMLQRYMDAIQKAYDENPEELPMRTLLREQKRECDEETKHLLAHGLLDALAFAGGLSVPGIMRIGLAVLHAKASPLSDEDRDLLQEDDEGVLRLVWEVIRRYAPVLAFSYWDPSFSKRTVLGLGMAMRDPKIWKDPLKFALRELGDYEKFGRVAWALESNGEVLGPSSRGCPGASLSLSISYEFFKEWMALQKECEWLIPEDKVAFTDYNPWAEDHSLKKACGLDTPWTDLQED